MAYLDAATVTDILRNRPVYIVTEKEFDSHSPKFQILAVQFALDDAISKALQAALCNAKGRFSPHDRWHREERSGWNAHGNLDLTCPKIVWLDHWARFICLPEYHIEEWQPDKGLVGNRVLSFESWFKRKIASERPSCTLVENWLTDWIASVTSGHIPAELRQRVVPGDQAEGFKERFAGDREEWAAQYGSPGMGQPWDVEPMPAQPAYA